MCTDQRLPELLTCWPTPCVCLLRIDAHQLCVLFQRQERATRQDIGSWNHVLDVVVLTAILTNAGDARKHPSKRPSNEKK